MAEIATMTIKVKAKDEASAAIDGIAKAQSGMRAKAMGMLGSVIPGFGLLRSGINFLRTSFLGYAKSLLISTVATIKLGIATMIAMWPIILVIAAIVAAILVVMVIYMNWAKIADFLKKAWEKFINWLSAAWEWLLNLGTKLWTTFTNFIFGLWKTIQKNAKTIWTIVGMLIFGPIFLAYKLVMRYSGDIMKFIMLAWDLIKAITKGDWASVKEIIKTMMLLALSIVTSIIRLIIDQIKKIPLVGKALGSGLEGMAKLFKIPGFDIGTAFVMRSGLAIVHRGEKIIPSHQVGLAGGGGGGGSTVNVGDIIINVQSISSDYDVERIGEQIKEYLENERSRYY
jgi:hypothetical protein